MPRLYRIWLRIFLLLNLLFSFHAWACSSGGCTKPSDFGSTPSSSSMMSSSSSSSQSPTSFTFSDTGGAAIPSTPAPKLGEVIQGDPKVGAVDFGDLARTSRDFRDIERKIQHRNRGVTAPAARDEARALASGSISRISSDDYVVRPSSVQSTRAAREPSRVRTISTGE